MNDRNNGPYRRFSVTVGPLVATLDLLPSLICKRKFSVIKIMFSIGIVSEDTNSMPGHHPFRLPDRPEEEELVCLPKRKKPTNTNPKKA